MGWAFVKWLRLITSQMQELEGMWSPVTCQLSQSKICYSNSSFLIYCVLVHCFSRVFCLLNYLQYWCFLRKVNKKSKIYCRNLSIFNIVVLNTSINILPFVSVIHDQLCTEGWQIAGQGTGNGQCSVDPHACRIPGWSCCTDLHSRELLWFLDPV